MIPNPLRASRRFAWAGRLTISWSIRRKESRAWERVGGAESGNLARLFVEAGFSQAAFHRGRL